MIKVTKSQFYKAIGPRDICVTSRGYDHSRFETRDRIEVGRAYDTDNYDENGSLIREYFFTQNFYNQVANEIEEVSRG